MEKIASFMVDHELLEPGVYVSRYDTDPATQAVVTTFDVRMTAPNREPVMDTASVHAIEHMGATYLRSNSEWRKKTVYFGPMGCRTGFYLVLFGTYTSYNVIDLLKGMYSYILSYEGQVPGALPRECGNWHDSDLAMAKWWARRFMENTLNNIDDAHTTYPQA